MYSGTKPLNVILMHTDLSSVQCDNVLCKEHDNDINILCTKIINVCTDAADRNIPRSVMYGCMYKNVPGWEEHVKPYRNKSIFWHGIWLDNERPKHGIVWEIMRRTRAQYHSQVRWVKQNTRYIQSKKMAQSVLKGNTKDLWTEVKEFGVIDQLLQHLWMVKLKIRLLPICKPINIAHCITP